MMKNAVEVHGLTVIRSGRTVLDGLDLTIGSGVTGLLGPSGCGKSTLLRSIVGVQQVAGGEVLVFGEPAGSAPLRHRIGYVTQAEWWRAGFIMSLIYLVIWTTIGPLWWLALGHV